MLRPNLSPSLPVPHSSTLSGFACLDDCSPTFLVKEQDSVGSGHHFLPNSLVNKKPVGEFRNFLEVFAPVNLGGNPVTAII